MHFNIKFLQDASFVVKYHNLENGRYILNCTGSVDHVELLSSEAEVTMNNPDYIKVNLDILQPIKVIFFHLIVLTNYILTTIIWYYLLICFVTGYNDWDFR